MNGLIIPLLIQLIGVLMDWEVSASVCSDFAAAVNTPLVNMCSSEKLSASKLILDVFSAENSIYPSCTCNVVFELSEPEGTFSIKPLFSLEPNYSSCGSRIDVNISTTPGTLYYACKISMSQIVLPQDSADISFVRVASPYDSRYCLELSIGSLDSMSVECSDPAGGVVAETTPTGSPTKFSTTTSSTSSTSTPDIITTKPTTVQPSTSTSKPLSTTLFSNTTYKPTTSTSAFISSTAENTMASSSTATTTKKTTWSTTTETTSSTTKVPFSTATTLAHATIASTVATTTTSPSTTIVTTGELTTKPTTTSAVQMSTTLKVLQTTFETLDFTTTTPGKGESSTVTTFSTSTTPPPSTYIVTSTNTKTSTSTTMEPSITTQFSPSSSTTLSGMSTSMEAEMSTQMTGSNKGDITSTPETKTNSTMKKDDDEIQQNYQLEIVIPVAVVCGILLVVIVGVGCYLRYTDFRKDELEVHGNYMVRRVSESLSQKSEKQSDTWTMDSLSMVDNNKMNMMIENDCVSQEDLVKPSSDGHTEYDNQGKEEELTYF